MTSPTARLRFPQSTRPLEEINLPPDVIEAVAGALVTVEVLAEEPAMARRLDKPDESPCLIDDAGVVWNDYRPLRALFIDPQGRRWRIPRAWLHSIPEDLPDPALAEFDGITITETLNLPTDWDLTDINVNPAIAMHCGGKLATVEVRGSKIHWRDPHGTVWRLPNWRRRQVRLPSAAILSAQNIPDGVASRFGGEIVTVNYHPGSLCCLPEHYRFRDQYGRKWPIGIADCTVVGYGEPVGEPS